MLKLGTQNISALYVGGAKIKRALVGTEQRGGVCGEGGVRSSPGVLFG